MWGLGCGVRARGRHVGELERADDLEARAEGAEVGLARVAERGVVREARGGEHVRTWGVRVRVRVRVGVGVRGRGRGRVSLAVDDTVDCENNIAYPETRLVVRVGVGVGFRSRGRGRFRVRVRLGLGLGLVP